MTQGNVMVEVDTELVLTKIISVENVEYVETGQAEVDSTEDPVLQTLNVEQKQNEGMEKVVVAFGDFEHSFTDHNFELRRYQSRLVDEKIVFLGQVDFVRRPNEMLTGKRFEIGVEGRQRQLRVKICGETMKNDTGISW